MQHQQMSHAKFVTYQKKKKKKSNKKKKKKIYKNNKYNTAIKSKYLLNSLEVLLEMEMFVVADLAGSNLVQTSQE